MSFAKLSIDLEAKLANLQAGLDKAGVLAEKSAKRIGAAYGGVKTVIATLGPALAASLTFNGITAFLRETAAGIDALNDLSDATGASIENLSALEDAAGRVGTELSVVGDAIIKMNQQLASAKAGSATANTLKAIGLEAAELRRMDPAEALLKVAQALDGYEDDANKARIVQDLFGKSVKEVAPLLKDLAEAGKLNASVTKAQADEVDRFNKQLALMEKNATDAARGLTMGLIPKINEFFARLSAGREVFGGFWASMAANAGESQFVDAADGVKHYSSEIARLTANVEKLKRGGSIFDTLNAEAVEKDLQKARKMLDFYQRIAVAGGSAGGGRGFVNPPAAVGAPRLPDMPPEADKPAQKEKAPDYGYIQPLPESLANALDRLQQSDANKLAALRIELQELLDISAGGGSVPPEVLKRLHAEIEALDPAMVKAAEQKAKLDALLANTPSAIYDETIKDIELLNDWLARTGTLADGTFDPEVVKRWAEAVGKATERFNGLQKETAAVNESIGKDLGMAFSSSLEQAIIKFESFKDIALGLVQDIAQILTRKLVTEKVGKAISDWTDSINWGQLIGSMFGSANGNAFDSRGVVPFASGGVVTAPTLFRYAGGRTGVMGEAGAEGILPLKRGRNGKLGVIAEQGASSPNITINLSVPPGVSADEFRQSTRQMAVDMSRRINRVRGVS